MAASSTAPRSRTRNAAHDDDAVAARALQFAEWARRNARWILIGAAVLFVLGAALFYYRVRQSERREEAARGFTELSATAVSGNTALAVRDLLAYIRSFEGTREADEARILLGRVQLQAGQPARAVAALQPVAADAGDDALGAPGALLLGAAQAQAGQRDAAMATYLRVADDARLPYLRESALLEAAILREAAGDFAGAAELYGRLEEQAEEGSPDRSIYGMRLAEAQARAEAAGRAAPAGR